MEIRLGRDYDLEVAASWWAHYGQPAPHQSTLPPKFVVVELNGKPAAMGWMIETDTATCLFEWISRDPSLNKEDGKAVLKELMEGLKRLAKVRGYKLYMSFIMNKSLKKLMEDCGAKRGDVNLQNMIGAL